MSWARVIDPVLGDGWVDGMARVVAIRSAADAARVLRVLGERGGERGGGRGWTPVLGLPEVAAAAGVYLDMAPLSAVRSIDAADGAVHVEAGATWGAVQGRLAEQGLTLGPLLGLGEEAIVESLAGRWDRRPSPRYGFLRDGLLALRAALPSGVTRCAVAPRRATGPDLARLPVGAGHRAGLITDVHLRVWPVVAVVGRQVRFRGWNEARAAAMAAWGAGCRPAWWCVRRAGRSVELVASVVASEAARFDGAVGVGAGVEPWVEEPVAPLSPVRIVTGADLAAGVAGIAQAEVWDLRPEGATVYVKRAAEAPVASAEWSALAERVFGALEQSR